MHLTLPGHSTMMALKHGGANALLELDIEGKMYTPEEIKYCQSRKQATQHFTGRWAAKEAVIKAWSGSRFAQRPVLPEGIHRDIEVITDMWGRPRVRLMGAIAEHLADVTIHVSLTHDGDTAAAVAILETP